MKTKTVIYLIFFIVLLYPVFALFQLWQMSPEANDLIAAKENLQGFQISIWVSWLIFVSASVYYKWTKKKNLFFNLTYAFILVGGFFFGYFAENMSNAFEVNSDFSDNYSFGILAGLQNIITAVVITAILQIYVWWFTRRWHRRMK